MKTIEVRRINMVETSKDDYKLANDELMRSNYYRLTNIMVQSLEMRILLLYFWRNI